MKQEDYDNIKKSYNELSKFIGLTSLKEMEGILFDTSTGSKTELNPAQVAQISKEKEHRLNRLHEKAIDQAFEQIQK